MLCEGEGGTVAAMSHRPLDLLLYAPEVRVPAGMHVLHRGAPMESVVYIESGQVALGLAGVPASSGTDTEDARLAHSHEANPGLPGLAHQIGVLKGPAWLEAPAALLGLPSALDAFAETPVRMRRVSLASFQAALDGTDATGRSILLDLAHAHREQTERTLSRFAKDAEARCAEWLLRHADSSPDKACVKLELRKRAIAAQLGIAPETLSRVLRHLRERHLISGSGRILNLVDPNGLRTLAGS